MPSNTNPVLTVLAGELCQLQLKVGYLLHTGRAGVHIIKLVIGYKLFTD